MLALHRRGATWHLITRFWVLLLACAAWGMVSSAHAQQPPPALRGHVVDTTRTLSEGQRQQLEDRLTRFEQARGTQIVVLLVPSTHPEDIAAYANRVANHWKIGRHDVGDGLLVVVAKDDRKVRIEVAKSLEGAIPDLAAKRIISDAITPHFKSGDFAAGLNAAVDRLTALVTGEGLPTPTSGPNADVGANQQFEWTDLSIFLFFAVPLVATVARRLIGTGLGALLTGVAAGGVVLAVTGSLVLAVLGAFLAALFALFIHLPSGRGGRCGPVWDGGSNSWDSGSSGSDSGGFSSGGGGDFGGGGASGDW